MPVHYILTNIFQSGLKRKENPVSVFCNFSFQSAQQIMHKKFLLSVYRIFELLSGSSIIIKA